MSLSSNPDSSTESVVRARSPRTPPQKWQSAVVLEVIEEAPDAVTLRLQLSESSGFVAGQYYNVRLDVAGRPRPIQRSYSVGSAPLPDPSIIDLGIREMPGGMISPRLVREFGPGSRLAVRGPTGRFTWTGDDGEPVLLVGAGSGVVPLMSMVRFAAASGLEIPVSLVCSAATYDHMFYREELAQLATQHRWLRVVHTVTRDPHDPRALYHRRIDASMLSEVLNGTVPPQAYLCGPPAMVETAAAALKEFGVNPERVHSEKYD